MAYGNKMKTFKEHLEERTKLLNKLGYDPSDLEEIRKMMKSERREWERRFKTNCENLIVHADTMRPIEIVRYAKELTDAELQVIEEKHQEWGPIEGEKKDD